MTTESFGRTSTAAMIAATVLVLNLGFAQNAYSQEPTVSANSFNRQLRIHHELTGHKHRPARVNQSILTYNRLRRVDRKVRKSCTANDWKVRATYFHDGIGYRGDNLAVKWKSYAELSANPAAQDFSALGPHFGFNQLPYRFGLWIHYRSRAIFARKRDVGAGGPRLPRIDLTIGVANALRFQDGLVRVTKRPCRGIW